MCRTYLHNCWEGISIPWSSWEKSYHLKCWCVLMGYVRYQQELSIIFINHLTSSHPGLSRIKLLEDEQKCCLGHPTNKRQSDVVNEWKIGTKWPPVLRKLRQKSDLLQRVWPWQNHFPGPRDGTTGKSLPKRLCCWCKKPCTTGRSQNNMMDSKEFIHGTP